MTNGASTMAARNTGDGANVDRADAATKSLADDVDKIRDIIFGGQMREYTRRFDQLEKTVVKATGRLERDMDKRLAKLEAKLTADVAKLTKSIVDESSRRQADTDLTNDKLADMESNLVRQLGESQAALSADLDSARDKLEALVKETRIDLTEEFAGETTVLGREKVAATELASLMQDLAKRLLNGST